MENNRILALVVLLTIIFAAQGSFAFSMNGQEEAQFNLDLSSSATTPKSSGIISYVSESYEGSMNLDYKYFATVGKVTNDPLAGHSGNNISLNDIEAGIRVTF